MHKPHKGAWCISEPKRHHLPLMQPKLGLESGFPVITFSHPYVAVTTFKINFGKYICTMQFIKHIVKPRNGVPILHISLLMALQSVHILRLPSFLGSNNTGTSQGLRLSWTKPFSNNSLTWDSIYLVSWGLVQQVGLLRRLVPGTKSTWCSIPLRGGNPGDISLGNTSPNSCNRSETFRGMVSSGGILVVLREVFLERRRWKDFLRRRALLISPFVAKWVSFTTFLEEHLPSFSFSLTFGVKALLFFFFSFLFLTFPHPCCPSL